MYKKQVNTMVGIFSIVQWPVQFWITGLKMIRLLNELFKKYMYMYVTSRTRIYPNRFEELKTMINMCHSSAIPEW